MTGLLVYLALVIALAGHLCCHHGEGARLLTRDPKEPS